MPTAAPFKPMQTSPVSPPAAATSEVLAFPASVAQQMFWYLELLQGSVTAFNVPLRYLITGPLDIRLFERALNAVIERHEVLRTCFGEENGELLQIVQPEMVIQLPVIDISHFPADRLDDEVDRLGSIEAHRSFALARVPLLRVEMLRLAPERHIFHFTVHHALFDGMSMGVFSHELTEFYQAFFENRPPRIEPLAIQYGDYSVWQKAFLESPQVKSQLEYWKRQLDGMTEVNLPTDFPRPPVKSWKGDITSILLPKELSDSLQAIAARQGATLFHVHLAAFLLLLHRYSGDTDIAVGAPVVGRSGADLEALIGVFINTLIFRANLDGDPEFPEFLRRVRDMALEALENQELPFETLVGELRPARDPSRNPLFQVNFNHHRSFTPTEHFGDVTLTTIPSRSPGTIFDLHMFFVERDEGWRASLDFSTDLFSRETADRMLGHLQTILEEIVASPQKRISELEILTADERQAIVGEWAGQSSAVIPQETTLAELFLTTAARFADRIALAHGETQLTYRQLRADAVKVARDLAAAGVQPGDVVAIVARPGAHRIAGLLGTILAGGCCAAFDPAEISENFAARLRDTCARVALIDEPLPPDWCGTAIELPTAGTGDPAIGFPPAAITPSSPAHLLYTAGTTGAPKGVLLPHRGIIRLVRDPQFLEIQPDDVVLHASPVALDPSLLEIWGALLNGARLVIPPANLGLDELAETIEHNHVTVMWLHSGVLQALLDEQPAALKSVRTLLAGGDVLASDTARSALENLPNTRILTAYGPTENSTVTTWHQLTRGDLERPSIPIGRPIINTTVYLLDDFLRPVPIGIPGELFTGGDGLAAGYFRDPENRADDFVDHPQFGRLLRTGDICRRSADGTLEFLHRKNGRHPVRNVKPATRVSKPTKFSTNPACSTTSRLTAIWEDLLGITGIGPDDDFFDLGGHSLMTLRLFSRIHREFGKSLPLATLLKHPTIAQLATQLTPPEVVAANTPSVTPAAPARSNIITLNRGAATAPLFCIHGGDGGVIFYRSLAALMPRDMPFHAIESLELGNSGSIAQTTIEETAANYLLDLLRIQPHGPYRLAGYSFGGVVAHEMACQLEERGESVEFLGMFDTDNPAAPVRRYGLIERFRVFWRHHRDIPFAQRLGLLRQRVCQGVHTNRQIRAELEKARTSGPADAYSDLRRVQVREENWRAMQAFHPRPVRGKITLFKSTHVSDKFARLNDYGWSPVAAKGTTIIPVEGEHLELFADKNVNNLAIALTGSLPD